MDDHTLRAGTCLDLSATTQSPITAEWRKQAQKNSLQMTHLYKVQHPADGALALAVRTVGQRGLLRFLSLLFLVHFEKNLPAPQLMIRVLFKMYFILQ